MSPKRAIFFDIDDTLIATKSMFEFQAYFFAHAAEYRLGDPRALMADFKAQLTEQVPSGRREDLNRAFYRSFEGRSPIEVELLAERWFKTLDPSVWVKPAVRLLEERRAQ